MYADYKQAAGLLNDDLVWSSDFEAIRKDLSQLISQHASANNYPLQLTNIVQTLIADENDLSI